MNSIKETLQEVMRNIEAKRTRCVNNDPEAWLKNVLTKKELKHIKFNYFRKGILSISVDSSGWLYTLNLRKGELLDKLRSTSATIEDIRFRLGETQ